MGCQRVTTNHGRSWYGVGFAVTGSSPACASLGYSQMLSAQCFEYPPPEPYVGWCFYNDEYIVSLEDVADSLCPSCIVPPQKYDCINGKCEKKSVYGTPGIFNSLDECQGRCAAPNACDKCLTNAEYNSIISEIDHLKGCQ